MWGSSGPCVVIGGSGRVGGLMMSTLDDRMIVCVIDPLSPPSLHDGVKWIRDDIASLSQQSIDWLRIAELVMMCVPEDVALRSMTGVAAAMPSRSILIDTVSVKTAVSSLSQRCAAQHGIEALSINPMFAPALGWNGRPVAILELCPGPLSAGFLAILERTGARLVRLADADQHDRLTATLQTATHATVLAFGQALRQLGADIEILLQLAPPPHLTMLALLARIVSGVPEVYWDIQVNHDLGPQARAALHDGLAKINELADAGNPEGFAQLFAELSDCLGAQRSALAHRCAALFESAALLEADPATDRAGRES
jgi:4-amino-4-deoxyprephenate dehydrogenase